MTRQTRSITPGPDHTSYAVDITSTLAFGVDLNTLEHGKNQLQQHIQRVFTMLNFRIFFPIPYWRWVRLPTDRRLARSLAALNRAVAGFIEQARARMALRPELFDEPENFPEAMLAAQRADGTFTDEEIVGNTFTLLIAGEDTTAHTMAWTGWYLAQNPTSRRAEHRRRAMCSGMSRCLAITRSSRGSPTARRCCVSRCA
jgi:cytochrome P450